MGLALVEGLPAAAGARLVPDCLMRAPSVERGGGKNGWADGLTGGAVRSGLEPPTKHPWSGFSSRAWPLPFTRGN